MSSKLASRLNTAAIFLILPEVRGAQAWLLNTLSSDESLRGLTLLPDCYKRKTIFLKLDTLNSVYGSLIENFSDLLYYPLETVFRSFFQLSPEKRVPARSFPQDRSCVLLRRNSKRAQIRESQLTFDRQETKIAPKKLPLNKYDPNIWHLRLRLCSPNWNQLEVVSSKANRKV